MRNETKREAQEALFTAIKEQAETNMHSALRAARRPSCCARSAEAYRLTAGGSMPVAGADKDKPAERACGQRETRPLTDEPHRRVLRTRGHQR